MAAKLGALQKVAEDTTLASCDVRLAVLLLTEYFNAKHGCSWPSRNRLSEQLGVAPSTITRALDRLESHGHFVVMRNKGRGKTNKYYPAFITEMDTFTRLINEASKPKKGRVHAPKKVQHSGKIKGAPTLPINDDKERTSAQKRAHRRTEKGASAQQDSFYNPVMNPFKGAPLASPPDGGERRSPHDGDERPKEAQQDNGGQAEGDYSATESLREAVNSCRGPAKGPKYWAAKKDSDYAETLSSDEKEKFWNKRMAEDERG